jgi:hypothetical protein
MKSIIPQFEFALDDRQPLLLSESMKLRANLKKHARALLGNEYTPEAERELIRLCLLPLTRTPGAHVSHDRADRLALIDKVLGTYGVEGMLLGRHGEDLSGTGSEQGVMLDCQYCNAGDTYALTVLYVNGRLCLGDWGSLVERLAA